MWTSRKAGFLVDQNTINTVALAVLYVLVLGVWKPWSAAYAREKGKNLARKEDLSLIHI